MQDISIEQIEQYFRNELPAAELLTFEKLLQTDQAFKTKVEDHRLIFEGLRGMEMDTFRATVGNWEEEAKKAETPLDQKDSNLQSTSPTPTDQPKINPKRSINWRVFMSAAAVLLFLIIGSYFILGQQYQSQRLAATNYEAPILPSPRSGSPAVLALDQGITAMKEKDFESAISFFKKISTEDNEYIEAQFYLGHSFYQQGQFQLSISPFQNVVSSQDSRFAATAEWMTVIAHLNGKHIEQAQSAIQNILNQNGHSYQEQALQLQNDMESFWFDLMN